MISKHPLFLAACQLIKYQYLAKELHTKTVLLLYEASVLSKLQLHLVLQNTPLKLHLSHLFLMEKFYC